MSVEIPPFQCPRCWADPHPSRLSKPRICAFTKDGQFKPVENWNCATLALLLGAPGAQDISGQDESIQVVPAFTPEIDPETEQPNGNVIQDGWIVLTRAFHNARTNSLMHVGEFHPPQSVSWAFIEDTIKALQEQAKSPEILLPPSAAMVTLQ